MKAHTESILGYSVDARDAANCVVDITDWIATGNRLRWLACINPHGYVVALKDRAFSDALHSADWLIPDGFGIVLASRCLKGQIRQRITGSDIFWAVQKKLNNKGSCKVFFLGSTDKTLADIRVRMASDFPRLNVVGTYSPPFKATYTPEET